LPPRALAAARWDTLAGALRANKNLIVPRAAANNLLPPTSLVRDAQKAGLLVHAWAFRNENEFLASEHRIGDPADPTVRLQRGFPEAEYRLFYALGIDGLFSDQPETAVSTREAIFRRE
jgi:glycerophosphoryl diester phosphodiesterase